MSLKNKNGILLLDKPIYVTSNRILQITKKILEKNKVGYSGTLDPLATGCLPLLLNQFTKYSDYVTRQKKVYFVKFILCKITETYDSDGILLRKKKKIKITIENIIKILSKFIGNIIQTPSLYSSIKYKGKHLYKYARNNIKTDIKKRQIFIYSIELVNYQKDEITLSIICSKGTYIRSIISDIGYMLGCGSYIECLQRIKLGYYKLNDLININCIKLLKKNKRNKIYINYFIHPFINIHSSKKTLNND